MRQVKSFEINNEVLFIRLHYSFNENIDTLFNTEIKFTFSFYVLVFVYFLFNYKGDYLNVMSELRVSL